MDYSKLNREELLSILDEDTVDIDRRIGAKAELGRRDRTERKWTRGDRWTAAGVIFAFMFFFAAPFYTKIPAWLDKSTPPPVAGLPAQPLTYNPQPSLRVKLRLMIGGYELSVANEGQTLAQHINVDIAAWQWGAPGVELVRSDSTRDLIPGADVTIYSVFGQPPENWDGKSSWIGDLFWRDRHEAISGYFVATCNNCSSPRAWAFYVPPEGEGHPKEPEPSKKMYSKYGGEGHPWPLVEFHYPGDKPSISQCVDFPRGVCGTKHDVWSPR